MWPKLRSVAANSGLRNNNVAGGIASPELQRPKHVSSGSSSSSMPSTVNVNEEYRKALRTKSYVDVCTKIHRHLRRSPCTRPSAATSPLRPRSPTSASSSGRLEEEASSSSSSSSCTSPLTQLTPTRSPLSTSSSPFFSYSHLPDDLLEPHNHEVLVSAVRDPDLHALFADYFDASAEACNVCGSLLLSVDQLRRNHRSIQRLFNHATAAATLTAVDCAGLGAYVERQNPLSALKNVHFRRVHDLYESLIRRLLRARGSIMRRARLVRLAKRASALSLVVACGALATAVLVVAAHTVVVLAVAGAPALAGPFGAWVRRRVRVINIGRPGRLTRLGEQVDAAARGAYIMSRDMETMSRMVTRLHDEVEHGKDVVRLFLRSRERWVLREVAEEAGGAGGFTELLEELEEHVYWCLLTINRTRGLVAQEISAGAPTTTKTTSDYIRG